MSVLSFKQFLVLFCVTLVPFLSYFFLYPYMMGFDSYYVLDFVCHGAPINKPMLSQIIFFVLPCDFLMLKIVLFLLCFACVCFTALTGMLFDEKNGWKAGFTIFGIPLFLYMFLEFENAQFSFPFWFAAVYFFLRNQKNDHLKAAGLLCVGGLIWQGAIYEVLGLALSGSWLFRFFALGLLAIFNLQVLITVLPDVGVSENQFGKSFLLLLWGYLGFARATKNILPQLLFFFVLGVLNAKFMFFIMPFLAIGFWQFTEWVKPSFRWWMYFVIAGMLLIHVFMLVPNCQPSLGQIKAVQYAVSLDSGQVQNDWDFGHWVTFYGGDTNSRYHWSQQRDWHEGVILTRQTVPGCELKQNFGDVNVFWC